MHSTVAIDTNYGDGISACYIEDIYAIETLASLVVIIILKNFSQLIVIIIHVQIITEAHLPRA